MCGQVRALACLRMVNGLETTLARGTWKAQGIGMYQWSLPAQGGSGLSHQGAVSKIRMPGQIVVDPGLEPWVWTLGDDLVVNKSSRPQIGGGA